MASVNVTLPDVVDVVCVNNSPPKAKLWLLSVTRWKKPKQALAGRISDRRTLKDVIELWFKSMVNL